MIKKRWLLYKIIIAQEGVNKKGYLPNLIFFFVICEKIHDRSCMKFVDFSTLQVGIYTI